MNKESKKLKSIETKASSLATQLRRSFVIARKDLKIYYNKPPVLIQGILFPIILFIAMTIGREIQPEFVVSGLMAMVIFLTSTSIGPVVFPWETSRRTFERLVTCPISVGTILIGSVWSSALYGMIFSLIPVVLGLLIFTGQLIINVFIMALGIIVAGLAFSAFSLLLSVPPTDTPGNTMVLTVLIKFPLVFISPLFMAIPDSPVSRLSPLTYFVDIINVALGQPSTFGEPGLLIDVGFLVLFGLAFLLICRFLHGKTLEQRFQ